jgi:hypothetical protein
MDGHVPPGEPTVNRPSFGRAEVPMPTLRTTFLGMIVGGAAFLMSGMAVYLTMAQVQNRALQATKLQDRVIQTQRTETQYARFQPTR